MAGTTGRQAARRSESPKPGLSSDRGLQPAPDLRLEGQSDDGLIEAVSLPTHSFVLGLQWHPEMMFRAHPAHLRPFAHLIAAVTTRSLVAARG